MGHHSQPVKGSRLKMKLFCNKRMLSTLHTQHFGIHDASSATGRESLTDLVCLSNLPSCAYESIFPFYFVELLQRIAPLAYTTLLLAWQSQPSSVQVPKLVLQAGSCFKTSKAPQPTCTPDSRFFSKSTQVQLSGSVSQWSPVPDFLLTFHIWCLSVLAWLSFCYVLCWKV